MESFPVRALRCPICDELRESEEESSSNFTWTVQPNTKRIASLESAQTGQATSACDKVETQGAQPQRLESLEMDVIQSGYERTIVTGQAPNIDRARVEAHGIGVTDVDNRST